VRNIISSAWCTCVVLLSPRFSYPREKCERRRGVVREKDVRATAAVRPVPRCLARVERDSDARKQIVVCADCWNVRLRREKRRERASETVLLYYTKTRNRSRRSVQLLPPPPPLSPVDDRRGVACVWAQCFVAAGAGFDATNHAADVKGRGGGDRVPLARTSVCVCARARSFLV